MSLSTHVDDFHPCEIHKAFRPEDLAGHFVLAADPRYLPATWTQFKLGGRHLACSPQLPCFRLVDRQRTQIGFFLGFPISEAGELLVDSDHEVVVDNLDDVETWLYAWAGRWLAIFITPDFERVYMDPGGSMCAVYCQSAGIVAASSGLIPYTDQTQDRTDLVARIPIPHSIAMYPLGMTPRHGIDRLLPNHYLDLSTWRARRHWPCNPIPIETDAEATTREILALTQRNIAAVAARYPMQLSLTAGRDSRSMLAAARPSLDRATFFTTNQPTADLDVHIAKHIARDMRLNHRIIPFQAATEADCNLWLYRTGCSVGIPDAMKSSRMVRQLDPELPYLPGHIGPISKNFYGDILSEPEHHWDGKTITPEHLIMLVPTLRNEEILTLMTSWLAGVHLDNPYQILNLFYLEQRVGCWFAVNASATADTYRFELWPYNSRQTIELMFSLPLEFRKTHGMHMTLISQAWPELLKYPINEAPALFRIKRKATRILRKLKQ